MKKLLNNDLKSNAKSLFRRSILTFALAAAGAAFALTGCSDSDDTSETKSQAEAEEENASVESTIPHLEDRYIINQMSGDMRDNFMAVYNALCNFEESVDFPHPIPDENKKEVYTIMFTILYECPEIFQWNGEVNTYTYEGQEDETAGINLAYKLDQDTYKDDLSKCQEVVDLLKQQTEGMSDYDKELYVYDYLAKNITYDDVSETSGTIYGALVENRARCAGIGSAVKYICDEIGLKCVTLFCFKDEESFDGGHVWNAINIDGSWYDIDITADVIDEDTDVNGYLFYGAVNVPHTWIEDCHAPIATYYTDYFNIPESTTFDKDYHVLNGSFVKSGEDFAARYRDALIKAFDDGSNLVYLQFENKGDYNSFRDQQDDLNEDWLNNYSSDAVNGLGGKIYSQEEYKTIIFEPKFS